MNNIFTFDYALYATLVNKQDRTKEESRQLETFKHMSLCNSVVRALENLVKAHIKQDDKNQSYNTVNILEYDSVSGLYRIQVLINGKMKTIARIKVAKRNIYILVRETTAKELHKKYEIINYNLPAGYYVEFKDAYKAFEEIVNYHYTKQTA